MERLEFKILSLTFKAFKVENPETCPKGEAAAPDLFLCMR